MKVFIHYQPHNTADAFEGTRLRKTIKGACEAVRVFWVDSPQEDVSVAHFISPDDLPLLREQKAKGVRTVVSAFYSEDDPNASFLLPGKNLRLRSKALAFLNEADLILVPDKRIREFAKYQGVTRPIEVMPPAVRMNRFSKSTAEARVFPRYFGIRPEVKTVVATGSYADTKSLNLLKKVAKACPSLEFYFFGARRRYDMLSLSKRVASANRSKNLHFKDIVQDDMYRSALLYSLAYISNDDVRPDPIAPIEAFASKTQVVVFNSALPNPLLVEGKTARFFDTPEEMAAYLTALNLGEAESTIDSAYAMTKEYNLMSFGRQLKRYYEALASGEYR